MVWPGDIVTVHRTVVSCLCSYWRSGGLFGNLLRLSIHMAAWGSLNHSWKILAAPAAAAQACPPGREIHFHLDRGSAMLISLIVLPQGLSIQIIDSSTWFGIVAKPRLRLKKRGTAFSSFFVKEHWCKRGERQVFRKSVEYWCKGVRFSADKIWMHWNYFRSRAYLFTHFTNLHCTHLWKDHAGGGHIFFEFVAPQVVCTRYLKATRCCGNS